MNTIFRLFTETIEDIEKEAVNKVGKVTFAMVGIIEGDKIRI